jgi:hypothetical protein
MTSAPQVLSIVTPGQSASEPIKKKGDSMSFEKHSGGRALVTFGAVIVGLILAAVIASGEPRSPLPKIVYAVPVIIGAWLLADWLQHRNQSRVR